MKTTEELHKEQQDICFYLDLDGSENIEEPDLLYIQNENFTRVKILEYGNGEGYLDDEEDWKKSFMKNKNKNIISYYLEQSPVYNYSISSIAYEILEEISQTVQEITITQDAGEGGQLKFIGDNISLQAFPALKKADLTYGYCYNGCYLEYLDSFNFQHPTAELFLSVTLRNNIEISLNNKKTAIEIAGNFESKQIVNISMPNMKDISLQFACDVKTFNFLRNFKITQGKEECNVLYCNVIVNIDLNPKVQSIKIESNHDLKNKIIKKFKYLVCYLQILNG